MKAWVRTCLEEWVLVLVLHVVFYVTHLMVDGGQVILGHQSTQLDSRNKKILNISITRRRLIFKIPSVSKYLITV